MICYLRATISLPTKFKVSISAHYEDIKMDTKCGKWGGLGLLGVTENDTDI